MTAETTGNPHSPLAPLPPWTSGLALALLLPVPSLGTWVGLVLLPGQQTGRAIFFLAKVWLVALPILWRLAIERRALSWSPPRHGGFVPGLLLGLGMSAAILVAYAGLGPSLLDPEAFRRMGAVSGLNRWPIYLAGSLYWVSVNSVLEEMVWRWFVVERCEAVGWGRWSVLASAVGFTAHHVVALRVYCAWPATLVCAFGIFVGGAIWSALYRRTRSVWPGYLSHAIVDVAIFVLGWQLISGG